MRSFAAYLFVPIALMGLIACGTVKKVATDAAGRFDASLPNDAGAIDARPPAEAPASTDVTSGGAHLRGGTYSMDVQLGHPFGQGKSSGNTMTTEGGAAIKR